MDNVTNVNKLPAVSCDSHSGSNNVEVNKALDSVIVQMHGITSSPSTGNIQLGPVLPATMAVERKMIEALSDTGSPVTIITTGSSPRDPGEAASVRSNQMEESS